MLAFVSLSATQNMWVEKLMLAFICIAIAVAVWQAFIK
jgi:hypothetical protein